MSLTWADGWLDAARQDGEDADAIAEERAEDVGRINEAEERYLRCSPAARADADEYALVASDDWDSYPSVAEEIAEVAEEYDRSATELPSGERGLCSPCAAEIAQEEASIPSSMLDDEAGQ